MRDRVLLVYRGEFDYVHTPTTAQHTSAINSMPGPGRCPPSDHAVTADAGQAQQAAYADQLQQFAASVTGGGVPTTSLRVDYPLPTHKLHVTRAKPEMQKPLPDRKFNHQSVYNTIYMRKVGVVCARPWVHFAAQSLLHGVEQYCTVGGSLRWVAMSMQQCKYIPLRWLSPVLV